MGKVDAVFWVLLREESRLGRFPVGAVDNAAKLLILIMPGLWYATGGATYRFRNTQDLYAGCK